MAIFVGAAILYHSFPFLLIMGEWLPDFIGVFILIGSVVAISGLINGIKSFKKKEPSYKKYIGTIGSLLFVGFLVAIILSNLVDIFRFIKA